MCKDGFVRKHRACTWGMAWEGGLVPHVMSRGRLWSRTGYDCAQGYGRAQGYSHAQWRGDSLGDRLHVEIITVYGTLSDSVQCYKHYSCGKQLKRLSKRLSECS